MFDKLQFVVHLAVEYFQGAGVLDLIDKLKFVGHSDRVIGRF